jgi:hypothetical protein
MTRTQKGNIPYILKFKDIQSRKPAKCDITTIILKFKDIQSRKGAKSQAAKVRYSSNEDPARSAEINTSSFSAGRPNSLASMLGNLEYLRLYGRYLAVHRRMIPDRLLNELSAQQIASITTAMRNHEKRRKKKL